MTADEDDYFYAPTTPGMLGSAHSVSSDPDPVDDVVEKLHAAVFEVTGKRVEPNPKPRMGFL